MIKRILVALSGTPYTPSAIAHGVELAKAHDATLTGVTLVDVHRLEDVGPVPLGGGTAAHELAERRMRITEERVEEQIANFEMAGRATGIPCRVIRERGDPMQQLSACWRYHDLIVVGVRGLFEYGVVHNPDQRIVRLIAGGVRPILAVAESHRPVRRVLIAYNGSMESAKAMKRFVQMRLWPGVVLRIVCLDLPVEEAESLLADAADYCSAHGFEPERASLSEAPVPGLLEHAREWGADLVVMGATGRSRLARLLLGETVLHTMQRADIPLYLAR
jgi:nucleotide-binding universal stress UspA family protein